MKIFSSYKYIFGLSILALAMVLAPRHTDAQSNSYVYCLNGASFGINNSQQANPCATFTATLSKINYVAGEPIVVTGQISNITCTQGFGNTGCPNQWNFTIASHMGGVSFLNPPYITAQIDNQTVNDIAKPCLGGALNSKGYTTMVVKNCGTDPNDVYNPVSGTVTLPAQAPGTHYLDVFYKMPIAVLSTYHRERIAFTVGAAPAPVIVSLLPGPCSSGTMTLTWSKIANATQYHVYTRDSSNAIVLVKSVSQPFGSTATVSTTITDLPNGSMNSFMVSAVVSGYESAISNPIFGVAPKACDVNHNPTDPIVTLIGGPNCLPNVHNPSIVQTFNVTSKDADGDQVYYDAFITTPLGMRIVRIPAGSATAPQNTPVVLQQNWNAPGLYTIRVRATDVKGAISGWTIYRFTLDMCAVAANVVSTELKGKDSNSDGNYISGNDTASPVVVMTNGNTATVDMNWTLTVSTPSPVMCRLQNVTSGTIDLFGSRNSNAAVPSIAGGTVAAGSKAGNGTVTSLVLPLGVSRFAYTCRDSGATGADVASVLSFDVQKNAPSAITGTCSADQNNIKEGDTVKFTLSNIAGGSGAMLYVWSADGVNTVGNNSTSYSHAYATAGTYNPTVTIHDSASNTSGPLACPQITVTKAASPPPVVSNIHLFDGPPTLTAAQAIAASASNPSAYKTYSIRQGGTFNIVWDYKLPAGYSCTPSVTNQTGANVIGAWPRYGALGAADFANKTLDAESNTSSVPTGLYTFKVTCTKPAEASYSDQVTLQVQAARIEEF